MQKQRHYVIKVFDRKTGSVQYYDFYALRVESSSEGKKLASVHAIIDRHHVRTMPINPDANVTVFKEIRIK